jgi:hypothetical protein
MGDRVIITRITIENIQSIKYARIECGPWVSFIGSSDVGKSAIVRALHALLTNRRGDSLIRHGEQRASVTLDLASGHAIGWTKGRGKSGAYDVWGPTTGYIVDRGTGDFASQRAHERYEKTSGEVPEAVRALLNVGVTVGGEELLPGIQRQHDPAFLLADTPRRRALILGEFDGTNILLSADGRLRRRQQGAQKALAGARDQLATTEAALDAYAGLPAAQDAAREAQAAVIRASEREERVAALVARTRVLGALLAGSARIEAQLEAWPAPAGIEELLAASAERVERLAWLGRVRVGMERARVLREALERVPVLHEGRLARLEGAMRWRGELSDLTLDRHEHRYNLDMATGVEEATATQLAALVGTPCPVCGAALTMEELTSR